MLDWHGKTQLGLEDARRAGWTSANPSRQAEAEHEAVRHPMADSKEPKDGKIRQIKLNLFPKREDYGPKPSDQAEPEREAG